MCSSLRRAEDRVKRCERLKSTQWVPHTVDQRSVADPQLGSRKDMHNVVDDETVWELSVHREGGRVRLDAVG